MKNLTVMPERRLLLFVGAVVFIDTMFYAVLAPLLPALVRQLHLSTLSAGIITASYAVGTMVGALPGGVLAVRAGPKIAVCVGLGLLGGATLVFAFVNDPVSLGAARFAQGVGGACSWAGGAAWLVAEAPPERRGALIGGALGAAIGGALLGPVIGVIANAFGRPLTFSMLGILALLLIAQARREPSRHAVMPQGLPHLRRAFRTRGVVVGLWLVALPAVATGVINVLGPLRLYSLGVGAGLIGATWVIATAIESLISPAIGKLTDRRGRLVPLLFGLAAATAALVCFRLATIPALLIGAVVAVAITLSLCWVPSMAMLSDAADASGLDQALAAGFMNLGWAGGQIIGAGVGGILAKVAGDALPVDLAAALCAATFLLLGRVALPTPAGVRTEDRADAER